MAEGITYGLDAISNITSMVTTVIGWKDAYKNLNEAVEGLGSFLTKKDKDILNGLTPEEFLIISSDSAVVKDKLSYVDVMLQDTSKSQRVFDKCRP